MSDTKTVSEEQMTEALAKLIRSVRWGRAGDLQVFIDASNQGLVRDPLTHWIRNQGWKPDLKLLKLLGYPEWVADRLTPELDEYEPNEACFFEPKSISKSSPKGGMSLGMIHDNLFREMEIFERSIGLQTLRMLQQCGKNFVTDQFKSYRITAWKSCVIDVTGTKKAPSLEVDRDGTPGEIIWQPFDLVPTPSQWVLYF